MAVEPNNLSQIIEELTCPVCLTRYKEAVLDCGHSVCAPCVNKLVQAAAGAVFPCPICRKHTQCPTKDHPLRLDYTIKGAVSVLSTCGMLPDQNGRSKLKHSGHSVKISACSACTTEPASLWCPACGDLCEQCSTKAHAIFKSHKPVPISEKEVPALCEKHGEKLKYFCNTCVKTICADCERDATSCKGHDTIFATEAAAAKRAMIKGLLDGLEQSVDAISVVHQLVTRRSAEVSKKTEDANTELEEVEKRLHTEISSKLNLLKKSHAELVERRIDQIKSVSDLIGSQLGQLTTALKLGKSVSGNVSDVDVLESYSSVEKALHISRSVDFAAILAAISSEPALKLNTQQLCGQIAVLGSVSENPVKVDLPQTCPPALLELSQKRQSNQDIQDLRIVSTYAGSILGFQDGPCEQAQFNTPHDVALEPNGSLVVADSKNHRIRRITPQGIVSTIAGTGTPGFADGPCAQAQFNFPIGIAVDGLGNIYTTDYYNHRVRMITTRGVITLAGSTAGFQNGPTLSAKFNNPVGVAIDGEGNVYIADHSNHCIRCISKGVVTTFAGMPGVSGYVDDKCTSAQFKFPSGVSVDPTGNILVSDFTNKRIRRIITKAGYVETVAGNGVAGFQDGPCESAAFNGPSSAVGDDNGVIYVCDCRNDRIREIFKGQVTTVCGSIAGFENGLSSMALLSRPYGMALDRKTGTLYIADYANHLIRAICTSRPAK